MQHQSHDLIKVIFKTNDKNPSQTLSHSHTIRGKSEKSKAISASTRHPVKVSQTQAAIIKTQPPPFLPSLSPTNRPPIIPHHPKSKQQESIPKVKLPSNQTRRDKDSIKLQRDDRPQIRIRHFPQRISCCALARMTYDIKNISNNATDASHSAFLFYPHAAINNTPTIMPNADAENADAHI